MSAFNGRWKLQSSENMKEYCRTMGMPEEAMTHVEVMEVIGDDSEEHVNTVTDTEAKSEMYIGGKLILTQQAALGVEAEVDGLAGMKHKCITTIDGNTMTTKSVGPPDFSSTQTVDGDKMTIVMKVGDVTCTRMYNKM